MMFVYLILIILIQNSLKSFQKKIETPVKPFLINISSSSEFCVQNTLKAKILDFNCESKKNLKLKTYEPTIYNISLIVIYDNFLEIKIKNFEKIFINLIKHVHDIYNTYDIINEVGRFNFLFHGFKKINLNNQFRAEKQAFELVENYIQSLKNNSNAISLYITGSIVVFGQRYERNLTGIKLEGIANINTFCTKNSIAITVHSGFNKLTSVIAHEIAHVLGVIHDSDYGLCECDTHSFIMSKSYSNKRYKFSVCSRLQLNNLKYRKKSCFQSENFLYQTKDLKSIKPLTFDEQCKINYSNLFKFDQSKNFSSSICEKLYCKLGLIELSNYPVLNNTPCNEKPKMVCCFGKCVINCYF